MKRTMKQVLGVVLCILLLLSVLPVAVLGAAETNAAKILNDAYALAEGAVLDYEATLTGKITKIDTPYSSQYSNISVIIEVPGHADKPMLCYRLKGDGADTLAVGDTITVTGKIKNYFGKIEFDAGCTLDSVVSGGGQAAVAPEDPKQIVDEAYALAGGESLPYSAVLVGKIITIDNPYDEGYKNITVTIEVAGREGKPIQCFRMKGTGVEELKIGDNIKVEGVLKRYIKTDAETGEVISDKVEFNGPSFIELMPADGTTPQAPSDPKQIVDEAYALAPGAKLPYAVTLTGKLTEIVTEYSEQYKNITVKLAVEGREDKPIVCYRMNGNGVDALKVGDTITVSGTMINYSKTDEETGVTTNTIELSPCSLTNVSGGNQGGSNQGGSNQGSNNQGGSNQGSNNQGGSTTGKTPAQIVAEAYALQNGQSLSYEATLTGKITTIDYAYSASSGDITVTIAVEGKAFKCYRLTGTGIDKLQVGNSITVKGKIKNYNGTIEFDKPVLLAINGKKTPGTADYSVAGLMILTVMATAALVVVSRKKIYC